MPQMILKSLLLIACAAHILTWRCDWKLTYLDGGRFDFKYLNDNRKLSEVFGKTQTGQPLFATLAGVLGLTAAFPGYLALCEWMRQYSSVYAALMFVGCILFFLPGMAHHVFCGVVEWFYIRMGRTDQARQTSLEFFKKTSGTMFACYVGLLIFSTALFAAVVTGTTSLPNWACIFNILPLFLALMAFRIPGTGNLVSASMTLGLAILI